MVVNIVNEKISNILCENWKCLEIFSGHIEDNGKNVWRNTRNCPPTYQHISRMAAFKRFKY